MENTYEAWVIFDGDAMVVSDEYDSPYGAINEMLSRGYTNDDLRKGGYTCCKIISNGKCWLEVEEERRML